MTTTAELMAEVNACEREITHIAARTQRKKQALQNKLKAILLRRDDMEKKHQDDESSRRKQQEQRLERIKEETTQRIDELVLRKQATQQRLDAATAKAEQAEHRAIELEMELVAMNNTYVELEQLHDDQVRQTRSESDAAVACRRQEAKDALRQAALHAMGVQQAAFDALDVLAAQRGHGLLETEAALDRRSRQQELLALAARRHPTDGSEPISEAEFEKERLKLCQGWHAEWSAHMETVVRAIDQMASSKPDPRIALDPDRPTCKEKNLQRVQARQREQGELALGPSC